MRFLAKKFILKTIVFGKQKFIYQYFTDSERDENRISLIGNPYKSTESENDDSVTNKVWMSSKYVVNSLKNFRVYFEEHNIDYRNHLYAIVKEFLIQLFK